MLLPGPSEQWVQLQFRHPYRSRIVCTTSRLYQCDTTWSNEYRHVIRNQNHAFSTLRCAYTVGIYNRSVVVDAFRCQHGAYPPTVHVTRNWTTRGYSTVPAIQATLNVRLHEATKQKVSSIVYSSRKRFIHRQQTVRQTSPCPFFCINQKR